VLSIAFTLRIIVTSWTKRKYLSLNIVTRVWIPTSGTLIRGRLVRISTRKWWLLSERS
jgi:hypothetical protein